VVRRSKRGKLIFTSLVLQGWLVHMRALFLMEVEESSVIISACFFLFLLAVLWGLLLLLLLPLPPGFILVSV
jgi:hypothetical protein